MDLDLVTRPPYTHSYTHEHLFATDKLIPNNHGTIFLLHAQVLSLYLPVPGIQAALNAPSYTFAAVNFNQRVLPPSQLL